MEMVGHAANTIQFRMVFVGITENVTVQLPLVGLYDSVLAAVGAEHDVINKVGITHDIAKVVKMQQSSKSTARGSPQATDDSSCDYPQ